MQRSVKDMHGGGVRFTLCLLAKTLTQPTP